MAGNPPHDLVLTPLRGQGRTVREWLTTFHLSFVALDPFTDEGAWILPTAVRVLTTFQEADVRVALLLPAQPDECRMFLGPWADELLTFSDPDRAAIKGFELDRLPAFVHLAMDGTVANAAEGWDPRAWQKVADHLARVTAWRAPVLPAAKDPAPFAGTPALA